MSTIVKPAGDIAILPFALLIAGARKLRYAKIETKVVPKKVETANLGTAGAFDVTVRHRPRKLKC